MKGKIKTTWAGRVHIESGSDNWGNEGRCQPTNLDKLINLIFVQSNLYAQQTGREFQTNAKEMIGFCGHKLHYEYQSTTNCSKLLRMWTVYWKQGNKNHHFSGKAKSNKNDKGFKICPVINHFSNSFSNAISNDELQSVDEHMVKFKGRSWMKKYVKKKAIKWGLKFWCCCASATGYLYQLDLYLGKKDEVELNLGESVVLKMCRVPEKKVIALCTLTTFSIVAYWFQRCSKKTFMAWELLKATEEECQCYSDKKMKRGDSDYQFSTDFDCCKWMDNQPVVMLFSNIEGMQTNV